MTMTIRSTFSLAAAVAALLVAAPFAATTVAQQAATPGAQRARQSTPARTPSELGLHGYSVVLVIGDMQAAGAVDSVPSAARKALTDMQAFLPYKRYQLLDAAWMVCCGSFGSALSGRVRGPESGEYAYSIETLNGTGDSKLTVRFSMRDTTGGTWVAATGRVSSSSGAGGRGTARGSSPATLTDSARLEHSRQLYEATRERDEAKVLAETMKQRHDVGLAQAAELEAARLRYGRAHNRVEDLQQMGGGASAGGRGMVPNRTVMDSTFSIALGETVVIGTSRLNGGQALIAILTAATKPGAAR